MEQPVGSVPYPVSGVLGCGSRPLQSVFGLAGLIWVWLRQTSLLMGAPASSVSAREAWADRPGTDEHLLSTRHCSNNLTSISLFNLPNSLRSDLEDHSLFID